MSLLVSTYFYIMKLQEFYHRALASESMQLPRVFGMTASPIKAKGNGSSVLELNNVILVDFVFLLVTSVLPVFLLNSASSSSEAYWKKINELETLMHSKVLRSS